MLQGKNKHVVKTEHVSMSAAQRVGGLFNTGSFERMSIFGKNKTKELPPLFSEAELNGASYEQVIDFLVSVNGDDFKKVIKVAELQRKAHADMAKVTGMAMDEPQSIFELQTIEARAEAHNKTDTEAGNFLDGDDDLTAAFMDDDADSAASKLQRETAAAATTPATSPSKGSTKINVSAADGPIAS